MKDKYRYVRKTGNLRIEEFYQGKEIRFDSDEKGEVKFFNESLFNELIEKMPFVPYFEGNHQPDIFHTMDSRSFDLAIQIGKQFENKSNRCYQVYHVTDSNDIDEIAQKKPHIFLSCDKIIVHHLKNREKAKCTRFGTCTVLILWEE
jgi:hypothetical protein